MFDCFNRNIDYLRISVTDRCNLRCTYCMPADGVKLLNHSEIISFEEIEAVVKIGVQKGIKKVRITGGEPLVRKGVVDLVRMIALIPGIEDLSMTTNGQLLAEFAKPLAEAGLMRVNVSLDTTDPDQYEEITRGGDIKNVIKGLVAAEKAGLKPIKLNCVVKETSDEPDALGVKQFAENMGYAVQFIHEMSLQNGHFRIVENGEGGNCIACNRLRLTANGKLMPCLFNNIAFDIRDLGIEKAIESAILNKPEHGLFNDNNNFFNIGG